MEGLEDDFHERKTEYVREKTGDPHADESHHEWDTYADEYELFYGDIDYISEWEVTGKSSREIFFTNLEAAEDFLQMAPAKGLRKRQFLVMLYGNVVAAIEAYLYSTFLRYALASDKYTELFVEYDEELAKEKFTFRDMYMKKGGLRGHLTSYIKTRMIFHRIEKTMFIYKKVLDVDFGDVKWLIRAVGMRHHCVHRAGYDEHGNPVKLSLGDLRDLIDRAENFGMHIERRLPRIPHPEDDGPF
jgi:hypothetical protein